MKLTSLSMLLVTILSLTAANSSRRPCPTLSATAKKPAPIKTGTGFIYLILSKTSVARSLASRGHGLTHVSRPQLDYSNSK